MEIKKGQQPVIMITKAQKENVHVAMEVFTDKKHKTVVALNVKRFKTFPPRVESVNVGTIIDPVYEDVITEVPVKILEDISCK